MHARLRRRALRHRASDAALSRVARARRAGHVAQAVPVVLPLLVHAAVLPPPAAPAAPRRGCTTFALVCFNIVHRVCAGAMPRATATAVVSGAARVS